MLLMVLETTSKTVDFNSLVYHRRLLGKIQKCNKKLSCRKETMRLLRGLVLAKCKWQTIFCGQYRSFFNHCDVIGLQSYRIRWNDAK